MTMSVKPSEIYKGAFENYHGNWKPSENLSVILFRIALNWRSWRSSLSTEWKWKNSVYIIPVINFQNNHILNKICIDWKKLSTAPQADYFLRDRKTLFGK